MRSIGDSSTSVWRATLLAGVVAYSILIGKLTPVDFDDAHAVSIDPEEERRECGGVDDAQTVRLPGNEGERRILIETHSRGDSGRRRA